MERTSQSRTPSQEKGKTQTGRRFKKLLETAKNIDKNNRRRLIRALEIVMVSKKPVPPIQKQRNWRWIEVF
jgi:tRNA A37 N6-isopentenylltransferase MiaA